MDTQDLSTSEVFGTAKKIALELEKLPLPQHAAVISMINSQMQLRQLTLQAEQQAEQKRQYELAQERQRQAQLRDEATRLGLVTQ